MKAATKTEARLPNVICVEMLFSVENVPSKIALQKMSANNRTGKDGSVNRCLYLRDRSSVELLCRNAHQNYLKNTLIIIDATMRATDVMRTISGRIFTPSVSSSKKRNSPALEAGNRASFFFLPLNFFYRPFVGGATCAFKICCGMRTLRILSPAHPSG